MSLIKSQAVEVTVVVETIKALREVLGTMVQFPIEETNEATFKKEFKGLVQRPIVEGKARELVQNKLLELVNSL